MYKDLTVRKLTDWSLIFGVVGLVYAGCLVVRSVISMLTMSSYMWHIIYMWLGFHFNVLVVLSALTLGLSAFTFTRSAVFSRQLSSDLELHKKPSRQTIRHLRATFMGICLLALTIIFAVVYLVIAMNTSAALPE